MDEIVSMTMESIEETLQLNGTDFAFEIISYEFTKAGPNRDIAVKSAVLVTNLTTEKNQEWTCVTHFVKTPKFFKISETECN